MTEANADALQIIIDEFKNLSPEITKSFMFNKDGEILASDESTTEEESKKLIAAFNNVAEHAQVIGGVENLTIQGVDRQLNIVATNNRYLTTVSSRAADEKIVKSLTRVIVPTVLGLMDNAVPEITSEALPEAVKPEAKPIQDIEEPTEEASEESIPEEASEESIPEEASEESIPEEAVPFSSVPLLPEPPVNQLMVEKVGGFLVPSDTVRVNGEVLAKWSDLYGDKQITEVHIETLEGKMTCCKFKPIKESENNANGIIQIPEKILQTLQTSKGKLVIVKPVIT